MAGDVRVGIVGATGAVGMEMLRVLEARRFRLGAIRLFASARSAGRRVKFAGEELVIEELKKGVFQGLDIVLFSAGGGTSLEYAPDAVAAGAVVIDNSSAFRMKDDVPLVVPEINAGDCFEHRGIIANPNCSTIITLMALAPLHRTFGLRRVIASTYQAVSGSGAMAIEELKRQVGQVSSGEAVTREVYPHQIAFNVIPHVDQFLESGYTKEEMKMENEGRKILHHPSLRVSCTCVRVPVYRAHSISVVAEFEKAVDVAGARAAIDAFSGVGMKDDPATLTYPMPLDIAGMDDCFVGRLRRDCAFENGLSFWVVGDQLLKGAALNAVQIAEVLQRGR
jgi:aspartate-semialdehyde dehydrogenase